MIETASMVSEHVNRCRCLILWSLQRALGAASTGVVWHDVSAQQMVVEKSADGLAYEVQSLLGRPIAQHAVVAMIAQRANTPAGAYTLSCSASQALCAERRVLRQRFVPI